MGQRNEKNIIFIYLSGKGAPWCSRSLRSFTNQSPDATALSTISLEIL